MAEIVVGGLLNPQRMERLAVISRQDAQALSPESVVSALVNAAFTDDAKTPAERDLAGVVQSEVAERLMVLAANCDATPEVRAAGLAGVQGGAERGQKERRARTRDRATGSRDRVCSCRIRRAEYAQAEIVRCAGGAAGLVDTAWGAKLRNSD